MADNDGVTQGSYAPPAGQMLELGRQLASLVSAKPSRSREKQTLQIEVEHGNETGTIREWYVLSNTTIWALMQLIAATGGRRPQEDSDDPANLPEGVVPNANWPILWASYGNLKTDADAARLCEWLISERSDRPYWITVNEERGQDNKTYRRVAHFSDDAIKPAVQAEIAAFKKWTGGTKDTAQGAPAIPAGI